MNHLDSWGERGGAIGVIATAARYGYWLWRRRKNRVKAPIFGWIGELLASKSLLVIVTIKYRTALAKIAILEREIEEAGLRENSASDSSADSSFVWPGSIPARSKPSTTPPSKNTLPLPVDDPDR